MIAKKHVLTIGLMILSAISFVGCKGPDLQGTYQDDRTYNEAQTDSILQKTIQYEGIARNPVIIIHGLLGSKIKDAQGKVIWGEFSYDSITEGYDFDRLAHPMQKGVPLEKLHNGSHAAGLLKQAKVEILGLEIPSSNYDVLVESLKKSGYIPEDEALPTGKNFPSLFIFSYDWRRDISENAAALHKFILEKRAMLQKKYEILYNLPNYDVQFDLVGHSMGGLVGRYYLRFGDKVIPDKGSLPKPDFAGAKYVDKLVVVGTPNAGYSDTLMELTKGLRLLKKAPAYPPALIGTFISYYEMLPDPEFNQIREAGTGKAIDIFDINTWIKYNWGLADPKQDVWLKKLLPNVKTAAERRQIAIDHLTKALNRAKRFKEAMWIHVDQNPSDVSVWLIAGHTVMTNAVLEADAKGNLKCVEQMTGDGKITYASASQDLRGSGNWAPFMLSPINWDAIFLMQAGHMGIMKSMVFDARLRQLLLDTPTQKYHEEARRRIEMLRKERIK